jgi:hypothetical protein
LSKRTRWDSSSDFFWFRGEEPPFLVAEEVIERYAHLRPDEEYFLMTFFGFLVVSLYFLGKIARKRQTTDSNQT